MRSRFKKAWHVPTLVFATTGNPPGTFSMATKYSNYTACGTSHVIISRHTQNNSRVCASEAMHL